MVGWFINKPPHSWCIKGMFLAELAGFDTKGRNIRQEKDKYLLGSEQK